MGNASEIDRRQVHTATDWFAAIEADPSTRQSDLSWVELFQAIAPKPAAFWSEVAQGLHARERHRDAYDAWQLALRMESPVDRVDRIAMAFAFLARVEDEEDYEHYFADKALAMFSEGRAWDMVAHIHAVRGSVGPMLAALSKAYVNGASWGQHKYDAPFGIEDSYELEYAYTGQHAALEHRFGAGYWRDLLPREDPPAE